MATIKEDGRYWVGDKVTGSQFRFRKGHVIPDNVEVHRIGDIPESPTAAKAEAEPENKAAAKPDNK